MIIVLMGYMASGKSTIGKILADKLEYEYIDLDAYIEEKEAKTVKTIFENKGEIYFRKIEASSLSEIIETKNKLILSLGGGTPCYGNNLKLLSKNDKTVSIYLKAGINAILKRVENETVKRPLIAHLKSEEDLREFVGKHLFERSQFYNQADITIVTDNLKVEDIVEEIVLQLF